MNNLLAGFKNSTMVLVRQSSKSISRLISIHVEWCKGRKSNDHTAKIQIIVRPLIEGPQLFGVTWITFLTVAIVEVMGAC